jgi:hypothetical protein
MFRGLFLFVARYFFHLQADLLWRDEEGCEQVDSEAARRHAVQLARAVSRTRPMNPADSIEVTRDDGTTVCTMSLEEALASVTNVTLH